jgi:hypothetical protein
MNYSTSDLQVLQQVLEDNRAFNQGLIRQTLETRLTTVDMILHNVFFVFPDYISLYCCYIHYIEKD